MGLKIQPPMLYMCVCVYVVCGVSVCAQEVTGAHPCLLPMPWDLTD